MAPWSLELATAGLMAAILLVDIFARQGKRLVWGLYLAGCVVLLALAISQRGQADVLGGSYVADGLSWIAKVIIVLGAGLCGAISMSSLSIKEKYHGAYAALLLAATLGMMVLVSSKELISLYVGLETSSVSLYGLAAISKKDDLSLEAGIKYLVIGALSSGLLLYGLSLAYLSTGTTSLDTMRAAVRTLGPTPLLLASVVFVLLGVGFKLSMVPLHVWTPDVYHGAPTPVSAFISVASKSAGFVFALRLLSFAFADLRAVWEPLLMAAAVLTMTVGNLVAIPQKSVKRLLAYSSISQAGYILVGFLGSPAYGASAVMFYLLVYTLTNVAAFTVAIAFSSATGSDQLEDYAGLARREPLLALVFAFSLLSLAGIPPLGGFVGKFYLFAAAMQRGFLWLVIVAALNSILSLYYYLLVLRRMYITEPAVPGPRMKTAFSVKIVLLITTIGIFWLGILPGPIMSVISELSAKIFPHV
ncbi:MAG: NADH-quinone oxidoreductase subunit N [Spirochaetia bacterium]